MFIRRRRWNSLKLLLWFLFQHPRLITPVIESRHFKQSKIASNQMRSRSVGAIASVLLLPCSAALRNKRSHPRLRSFHRLTGRSLLLSGLPRHRRPQTRVASNCGHRTDGSSRNAITVLKMENTGTVSPRPLGHRTRNSSCTVSKAQEVTNHGTQPSSSSRAVRTRSSALTTH